MILLFLVRLISQLQPAVQGTLQFIELALVRIIHRGHQLSANHHCHAGRGVHKEACPCPPAPCQSGRSDHVSYPTEIERNKPSEHSQAPDPLRRFPGISAVFTISPRPNCAAPAGRPTCALKKPAITSRVAAPAGGSDGANKLSKEARDRMGVVALPAAFNRQVIESKGMAEACLLFGGDFAAPRGNPSGMHTGPHRRGVRALDTLQYEGPKVGVFNFTDRSQGLGRL